MREIFTVTLLCCCLIAGAQNKVLIDSLRTKIESASPEEKFKLLGDIGFEYRYSFPDSTLFYCEQAYTLGKEINVKKGLSRPLSFIGLALGNQGEFQKALNYHNRAIEVAEQQYDSVQLAFGYNNLGRLYFDQGELVNAYENFIRSKALFEALGDPSGLAYVYRSFANLYASQKDFERALENSLKAYQLRKKIGDPRTLGSALLELGSVYKAINKTDDALRCFHAADSVVKGINNPVTSAEIRLGIAEILFETGDRQASYEAAQQVLQVITDKTNQPLYLRAALLSTRYYIETNALQKALALLEKISDIAESSGILSFQRDAAQLFAEIYSRQDNTLLARRYQLLYEKLDKALQSTDLNRQVERLEFQLQIEKKERENEMLRAKNAEDSALIVRQRFENLILLVVVASVATVAIIAWVTSRKRRLLNRTLALQNSHITNQQEEIRQQNESLSRNNITLQELNHEKDILMSIVAHDLKSPLHRIHGLVHLMELEGALTPSQKEYIAIIKSTTRSGLDLITDLLDVSVLEGVRDLPKKSAVDVSKLLQEKIKSFYQVASVKTIDLQLDNQVSGNVMTDENYVSRILENLISNAIKFSHPGTAVNVSALKQDGQLVLKVKDNGPGFSEGDKKLLFQKFKKLSAKPTGGESSNGLGLAIVKTLVDRLGGDIELNSHAGAGSEFVITLPAE